MNIRVLCPTRWTVRGDAMESILAIYGPLNELWNWASSEYEDTGTKAIVPGEWLKWRNLMSSSACH